MNVREYSLVIFLTALTLVGGGLIFYADGLSREPVAESVIPPVKPEPCIMYRIRVEQGLKEKQNPSTYTAQEQQAVNDLKAVLARWPQLMWLASADGKLVLVKMGTDGKPVGKVDGGI